MVAGDVALQFRARPGAAMTAGAAVPNSDDDDILLSVVMVIAHLSANAPPGGIPPGGKLHIEQNETVIGSPVPKNKALSIYSPQPSPTPAGAQATTAGPSSACGSLFC